MADQDTQTLNDTAVNAEVGGIVNPDSPHFTPDKVNQFNDLDEEKVDASSAANDDKDGGKTDEGKDAKKADEGADAKKDAAADKAKDTKKDDAKGDEKTRFDQHPDWQRMKTERDEARLKAAKLEGQVEALSQKDEPTNKKNAEVQLPYKDISKMSAEQIREWQEDDPKGYSDNLLAQAKYEAKQEFIREYNARSAQEREKGSLQKSYAEFETKHPDFRKMWDSGEIMKYIEAHPGENPKSAYFQLTLDEKIAAAVKKAKEETEADVTKRFQAKRKATVLDGGSSGVSRSKEDPAMQNTKQHGGRTAVLADKLRSMRSGAAH